MFFRQYRGQYKLPHCEQPRRAAPVSAAANSGRQRVPALVGVAFVGLVAWSAPGQADSLRAVPQQPNPVTYAHWSSGQLLQLSSQSGLRLPLLDQVVPVSTLLEARVDSAAGFQSDLEGVDNLDSLRSVYLSEYAAEQATKGLDITRLSATWQHGANTLTIGRDWSSFQDLLTPPKPALARLEPFSIAEQLRWSHARGFSFAVEVDSVLSDELKAQATSLTPRPHPSIVLSWRDPNLRPGQYHFAILATPVETPNLPSQVDAAPHDQLGWGVNIGRDWQVGGWSATLGVTVGDGIDYLLLDRVDEDRAANPDGYSNKSFMLNPRLQYSLSPNSAIQLEVSHYQSLDSDAIDLDSIDTLDTIHVGYTWSPWPSAQIGVKLVSKEVASGENLEGSLQLKFGRRN